MDERVDEKNAQDQDCIDDSSNVFFSDDPFFYREFDNSIETAASNVDKNHVKNLNLTADDYCKWLINRNAQVENYTPCSLINPEYDNFENEEPRISKFDSVFYTTGKNSKDLSFNAIILGFCRKLNISLAMDLTKDKIYENKKIQKLQQIKKKTKPLLKQFSRSVL